MAPRSKTKLVVRNDPKEVPQFSQLSQTSSDDGMAAALIQKMHSTAEKRRKEKEARYLDTYKKETSETIARSALEFSDYCGQIDKVFEDFRMAYAKAEDEIRSTWVKIIAAHAPFAARMEEHLAAGIQQEKEREDHQLLGIAYHKKSEESLDQIITCLMERDVK